MNMTRPFSMRAHPLLVSMDCHQYTLGACAVRHAAHMHSIEEDRNPRVKAVAKLVSQVCLVDFQEVLAGDLLAGVRVVRNFSLKSQLRGTSLADSSGFIYTKPCNNLLSHVISQPDWQCQNLLEADASAISL